MTETKASLVIDGETGLPDPTPPLSASDIPLQTANEARREMARVYRETRGKRLDSGEASKLVYILGQIVKAIEVHEIEQRLTDLEDRTNGKSLPAARPH